MKKLILFWNILIILVLVSNYSQSNRLIAGNSNPPTIEMLTMSNMGTNFWFSVPPVFEVDSSGFQNVIRIFITSTYSTPVKLEVPSKNFSKSATTIANDVIEIDVAPNQVQPFIKNNTKSAPVEQIYKGLGVHITADEPVIVYVVADFYGASDGFLALPVNVLGKEYIVAPYEEDYLLYDAGNKFPGVITVTAPYDSTLVSFTMGGNSISTTSGGLTPGKSKQFALNKGDVFAICTNGKNNDLSGSRIIASKPVSVISGNQCSNIPVGNPSCNYSVEQDFPDYSWGKYYFTPTIIGRMYSPYIRIFAKEANTNIYRNGSCIGTLTTSGGIINNGWFEVRLVQEDWGNRPAIISSDKPIAVVLCATGSNEDCSTYGDTHLPFTMNIIPLEQYQKSIMFCVPGTTGKGIYTNNNFNIVYPVDSNDGIPDDIMFGTPKTGDINWQELKAIFPGEDYEYSLKIDEQAYKIKITKELPPVGAFFMKASEPFAMYLNSTQSTKSYGYPAGCLFKDLTKINTDIIPPFITYTTPDNISNPELNNYVLGKADDDPKNTKMQSNLNSIILLSDSSYNYKLTYGDFIPGSDASTWWSIKVIDNSTNAMATLIFSDRAGNDTVVHINYTAGVLTQKDTIPPLVTWSIDSCTGIVTGKTVDKPSDSLIRSNLANININSFNYTLISNSITIGKTDSISWSLTPIYDKNDASATITFFDYAGNETKISLRYYSISDSIYSKDTITFNSLIIGDKVNKKFTLLNNSNKAQAINDLYLKLNDQGFTLTKPSLPLTLSQNDSTNFTITFTANTIGTFIDSIEVVDECGSKYLYILVANVDSVITSVDNSTEQMNSFKVYQTQNSNEISISYQLAEPTNINISIYDINGNKLYDIVNNELNSNGLHEINYDVSKLITGTYFIRFSDSKNNYSRKISIVK